MKPSRIAINGFGRIGRCVLRALYESTEPLSIDIVAINELADCNTIAHLTKYDSTHGRFHGEVSYKNDLLMVNGDHIRISHHHDIAQLPWANLNIDVVLECTGVFGNRAFAQTHLDAGAQRVLFSEPAQSNVDATIIYGINESMLTSEDRIISNASCTTNCIVPVISALHEAFGIENGVMTTIHSAMNDQPIIDAYHHTDLRKTRSAVQSIIPVDTELAKGIDRVLPELAGRFQAQAMRVPTINVSAIDLSVTLENDVTREQVNDALEAASQHKPRILGFNQAPLTSCDFIHDARSGIIDASQTRVAGKRLLKVLVWFDNEWAYANRMLDVVNFLRTL